VIFQRLFLWLKDLAGNQRVFHTAKLGLMAITSYRPFRMATRIWCKGGRSGRDALTLKASPEARYRKL